MAVAPRGLHDQNEHGPPALELRMRAVVPRSEAGLDLLSSLLVLHVARDETKQLSREGEHITLGEAARAKLPIDVLGQNLHCARIGSGARRCEWRRLRHNWNFCPLTVEPDVATYPRMMPKSLLEAIREKSAFLRGVSNSSAKRTSQNTAKSGLSAQGITRKRGGNWRIGSTCKAGADSGQGDG